MEGILVIKIASAKLFSFLNGGYIRDQERLCQTLQLLQWRVYSWSRTCQSNSSASSTKGVLVIKNVSVNLFSFFNGGYNRDKEHVCQTLQLLQWREYSWSRTCMPSWSASSMEGVLVIKNLSVKLFCFFNGGYNRDQGRVRSTSSDSSMEGLLLSKDVSVKLVSFFNGGSIGDQWWVCRTGQPLQWSVYWWSRTCLSNPSSTLMEGIIVIKNMSVKLSSFFSGGNIRDQERVCQTGQLLQWREYWWLRTCLSNSSDSLMEGLLVIMNVSVQLFCFFNGASIRVEGRACQTLQLHQWMVYWWSRTCLSNSSGSLMEGVLVIKNVSVQLFSFFSGGSIGYQKRVYQSLQLH